MERNTIKALRMYYNHTQKQMAEAIGYSTSALSLAENGIRAITPQLQASIARHYKIDDGFIEFLRNFERMNGFTNDYAIV